MAAVVTERWSARRYVRGVSAERGWDVTGVDEEEAARAAVGSDADPDPNAAFPLDSRLRAPAVAEVSRTGPATFLVRQSYDRPQAGSYPADQDPLDQPTKIFWGKGQLTEPTDIDADGRPILNSAGYPFQSGSSGTFSFRILTLTANQSGYDVAVALAYEDTINSDTVHTPGGDAEPGQCLCVSIEPVAPYDLLSEYVPVQYTFHLRKGYKRDGDGLWDAWKYRVRDEGYSGWYDEGGTKKTGPFVHAEKLEPPPEPVLLDGTGKPVNVGKYKVAGATGYFTPAAAPTALNASLIESTTAAKFLKYKRYPARSFAGLTIF